MDGWQFALDCLPSLRDGTHRRIYSIHSNPQADGKVSHHSFRSLPFYSIINISVGVHTYTMELNNGESKPHLDHLPTPKADGPGEVMSLNVQTFGNKNLIRSVF